MYVSVSYSLILPLETDWETTLLGHKVKLEWRLKVFSSTSNLWFWISPHQGTLTYSWILKFAKYMLSIVNEVYPLIFCYVCLVCDTNMYFSNNWYQSGLQFRICITCFMSFGIKDGNFMILQDSTLNFLHGFWNYYFNVMMMFKFDIKYVKLNLKAIVSMVFSFDLKLNLLCSYDSSLFMKNRWKLLGENSGNSVLWVSTDREFSSIDRMFLSDWSNRNRESIQSTREFMMNLLKFWLIKNSFWLIEFAFSIDQTRIENRSSHPDCLLNFSSWFRSIESCEFWIFTNCFHI